MLTGTIPPDNMDVNKPPNKLQVTNSTFRENTCSLGGAIYLDPAGGQASTFEVNIEDSNFVGNVGKQKGGAIFTGGMELTAFTINIVDSTFTNNSAPVGGAIYISNSKVNIKNSKFTRNKGEQGGAINFLQGIPTIMNCEFHNNSATTFGGALYLKGSKYGHIGGSYFKVIQNTLFTGRVENDAAMFYGSSDVEIANTSFVLTVDEESDNTQPVYAFVHDSALQITSPFNVTCPQNYKLQRKSLHLLDYNNQKDRSKFDYLAIKCIPCNKGSYSVQSSHYSWDSFAKNDTIKQIKCMRCPAGGNCKDGHIVNQPNYWGFKKDSTISFINCPIGYCSQKSITYDSCANNRSGYLCGQCEKNHIMSLLSSKCVLKDRCGSAVWLVPIIMLIMSMILLVLIFLNDLKYFFTDKLLLLKQRCLGNRVTKKAEKRNGDNSSGSFFANIRLIFFFYQLQRFTNVPLNTKASFSENCNMC